MGRKKVLMVDRTERDGESMKIMRWTRGILENVSKIYILQLGTDVFGERG